MTTPGLRDHTRQAFLAAIPARYADSPLVRRLNWRPVTMKTSRLVRFWRLSRLFIHLVFGVVEVAALFPWRSNAGRARAIQRWSRRMCDVLHLKVSARGQLPADTPSGAVLVANHVSWIDIFVLNTIAPSRFVAKAEVRSWPLIGWLCARTGTLFVTRERRHDTQRVNQEIAGVMAEGDSVAVFPEGSTTDGFDVIPFNASLLQPAVDAGVDLAPVALRYYDPSRARSDAASYVGEMTLVESIGRILGEQAIIAELDYLPRIPTVGRHRREVAKEAQAKIAEIVLSDSPIGQHASSPAQRSVDTATTAVAQSPH